MTRHTIVSDRPEDIGRRLQTLRALRGLTQQAAADQLRVGATTICKWESGELYPSFLQLINIIKTLQPDVRWLMGTPK